MFLKEAHLFVILLLLSRLFYTIATLDKVIKAHYEARVNNKEYPLKIANNDNHPTFTVNSISITKFLGFLLNLTHVAPCSARAKRDQAHDWNRSAEQGGPFASVPYIGFRVSDCTDLRQSPKLKTFVLSILHDGKLDTRSTSNAYSRSVEVYSSEAFRELVLFRDSGDLGQQLSIIERFERTLENMELSFLYKDKRRNLTNTQLSNMKIWSNVEALKVSTNIVDVSWDAVMDDISILANSRTLRLVEHPDRNCY
ncbi:hypothetical protein BJV82DRAFT_671049 [Fennellomyces sp. T-0311]|nr:hypothetical protein BJV82DRAFT_671049 [Fennellomyces sp. T-0311]